MKKDSKKYQDWFVKGDHEFDSAKLIFRDNGFMDTVGYHLHQTIEKYLKGFLLYHKQDYPITHHLVVLLKTCSKFNPDIIDYLEECERMNGYYIESKYPMDPPYDYSKTEMQKSIKMTAFLVKYIQKYITNFKN